MEFEPDSDSAGESESNASAATINGKVALIAANGTATSSTKQATKEEEEEAPYTVGDLAPAFLERNAHVHEWVFGAIAEIIDNSLDAGASQVTIDMKRKSKSLEVLTPIPNYTITRYDYFFMY